MWSEHDFRGGFAHGSLAIEDNDLYGAGPEGLPDLGAAPRWFALRGGLGLYGE